MSSLERRVALVTGGANGLGAAISRELAAHGASIVIADIADGSELAAELSGEGREAIRLAHDVTDPAAWERVVIQTERELGPIDILVNNAGVAGRMTRTADMSVSDYERIMRINIDGILHGCQAVLPGMCERGHGAIVNIASLSGLRYGPGTPNAAYAASKAAVAGMTRATAVEYARDGIRVNAVHPGIVETPLSNQMGDKHRERVMGAIPMRRAGGPTEIARVVVFLASDAASYVTGASIPVDGGWNAG